MKKGFAFFIYTTGLVLLVFQVPVYAYIDPGSVSIAIQAIAAAVLAGGTMITLFFAKIKSKFIKPKENFRDELDTDEKPEE